MDEKPLMMNFCLTLYCLWIMPLILNNMSVGSPMDSHVDRELSEPLDLTGSSLGRINSDDPPDGKSRIPLNLGINNLPEPRA